MTIKLTSPVPLDKQAKDWLNKAEKHLNKQDKEKEVIIEVFRALSGEAIEHALKIKHIPLLHIDLSTPEDENGIYEVSEAPWSKNAGLVLHEQTTYKEKYETLLNAVIAINPSLSTFCIDGEYGCDLCNCHIKHTNECPVTRLRELLDGGGDT